MASCSSLFAGLERDKFDNKTVSFEEHIKAEHNMWHYLYFIVLVKVKDPTEYTGPESYVAQMIVVSQFGHGLYATERCSLQLGQRISFFSPSLNNRRHRSVFLKIVAHVLVLQQNLDLNVMKKTKVRAAVPSLASVLSCSVGSAASLGRTGAGEDAS